MRFFLLLSSFYITLHGVTQINRPIDSWKDHISYSKCTDITQGDDKIFVAAQSGVFIYNTNDNSIQTISRTDGLSPGVISTLNYNPLNKIILVGFEDGNIDIISASGVSSIVDIKNANKVGDKAITKIVFKDSLAYLATGLGVLIVDPINLNVLDTYPITEEGNLAVTDITFFDDTIYVASMSGLYKAPESSFTLADPNQWIHISIPELSQNAPFNQIEVFHGAIIANQTNKGQSDALYHYKNGKWVKRNDVIAQYNASDLRAYEDEFVINVPWFILTFDTTFTKTSTTRSVTNSTSFYTKNLIAGDNLYALEEKGKGLIKVDSLQQGEFIMPNGPFNASSWSLEHSGEILWVSTGIINTSINNEFLFDGVHWMDKDGKWNTRSRNTDSEWSSFFDLVDVAIDPNNPNHVFCGTWGTGVIEMLDGNIVFAYDSTNSVLEARPGQSNHSKAGYLEYDIEGNLWIINSYAQKMLKVLKSDGNWVEIDIRSSYGNNQPGFDPIFTFDGNLWMIKPRVGIFVLNPGDIDNPSDDQSRFLTTEPGEGGLPSGDVKTIEEDFDGIIWIGTDKGIAIFYTPSFIFDGDVNAQQVFIEQEGNVQIVLETEQVNAIETDGGNRKWIGTESSGLFLLSEDGTEEIAHYTTQNSPLLSNSISDLSMEKQSGELFIATELGVQSLQTDANEGTLFNSPSTVVYPNPVKREYEGDVIIDGLSFESDVRITDIAGNLIFKTQSQGGRATWDRKNMRGEYVLSGVYLIFSTDVTGELTSISKVMVHR